MLGRGREQQVVLSDAVDADVFGEVPSHAWRTPEGAGFVVVGVGLEQVALAVGGCLLETSTMVSEAVGSGIDGGRTPRVRTAATQRKVSRKTARSRPSLSEDIG